ncbi:hypothetical protein M9Y10_000589 [Tritrichomonas musculus]|uniref:mitogen-activated protein kinase kinase n=1 Tax=Tritrichomonas musculus TaxID=1915356 RepID=A0ABR2L5N9_9EUKA
MIGVPKEAKILVRRDVKLTGSVKDWENQISYIEEEPEIMNKMTSEADIILKKESEGRQDIKKHDKKAEEKSDSSEVKTVDNRQNKRIESLEKENDTLKKFVNYLQSRLNRYEEPMSYEEFAQSLGESVEAFSTRENNEELEMQTKNKDKFVGPEDEEFQEVVGKLGGGATSEVFKVIDKRTGEVMCKKVIKEVSDEAAFKTLQNSLRELETVCKIEHPCICESLGYNMQEPVQQARNKKDDDDEYDYEYKEKVKKTTIALFFELLPFSVKEVIEKGLMSNTLKVRIAVEVAFGMSHVHRLGMMHRDLKLENIMMNSVFESKIIDFGLVHVSDIESSLTKGVGTLAYMSPEMVNEEEYNNKTDVYSYGIVLLALFTGRLPKQSVRDKMNKVDMKYPSASSKISEICIDLIKRCTSFKASLRPTFDEIIEYMFSNSFSLTPEVDTNLILRRYRELNRFKSLHNQQK